MDREVSFDCCAFVFFQAEDGIRDLVRSRGLGDVYKRQQHPASRPDVRGLGGRAQLADRGPHRKAGDEALGLSLIHI